MFEKLPAYVQSHSLQELVYKKTLGYAYKTGKQNNRQGEDTYHV